MSKLRLRAQSAAPALAALMRQGKQMETKMSERKTYTIIGLVRNCDEDHSEDLIFSVDLLPSELTWSHIKSLILDVVQELYAYEGDEEEPGYTVPREDFTILSFRIVEGSLTFVHPIEG